MKAKILATNARFNEQVNALLDELDGMDNRDLNRRPAGGGWSAIQVLYHLLLVEEKSMIYIRKKLSFSPELEKAGFFAQCRSICLQLGLLLPIKFKAPESAGSELIPEEGTLPEVSARWQKIRDEWTDFFEKMPPALSGKAVYKHPLVGRIGFLQMLDFFILHTQRHQRQIRRILLQDAYGINK